MVCIFGKWGWIPDHTFTFKKKWGVLHPVTFFVGEISAAVFPTLIPNGLNDLKNNSAP